MQITFGTEKYKGQPIEVAKVVTDTPCELSGQFNLKQEFTDTTRTDMFYIVRKIRSATNGEKYFDWYEIINHVRFDDRFVPDKKAELEEDSAGILDLADLSDENSGAIIDIGEAIESLDERVAALEGGN
jgi:hypothetical protein